MILGAGANPQALEMVQSTQRYRAILLENPSGLRALLCVDDLFVAAYVSTTALLAARLARGRFTPLHWILLIGGCAAGVLDLHENHSLLSMLRWAELDRPIPDREIFRRSELSQLKWMLGHVAFVAAGLSLRGKGVVFRVLRFSLIFVQLPIGALAWTVESPLHEVVLWIRYFAFISGFATIAWLFAYEDERDTPA